MSKKNNQNQITVNIDGIIYLIDEKNQTASAKKCESYKEDIFIPSFINYKSKKYAIKSILSNFIYYHDQWCKTVQFAPDSQLETIEDRAFSSPSIQSIQIPSSVKVLYGSFGGCYGLQNIEIPEDSKLQSIKGCAFIHTGIESITIPSQISEISNGTFSYTQSLKEFIVSPLNPYFKAFDNNKILATKMNSDSIDFDRLLFGVGCTSTIKIPSFIKYISDSAFYGQQKICRIEISKDSKLEIIDKDAFTHTSIRSFTVPSSVKEINNSAFSECPKIEKIEFQIDTKLKKLSKSLFYQSGIKKFKLPQQVEVIEENAFTSCFYMEHFDVPENSLVHTIGVDAFSMCGIYSFSFPPKIKEIAYKIFTLCRYLQIVEIPVNSEIEFLDIVAFNQCMKSMILMIPVDISDYLGIFQQDKRRKC